MPDKRKFTGREGFSLLDTKWDFEVTPSPSKGKPNVIYIVLDDLGFAQLGCYGSTIHTPNIDRLAREGLRYNNFHTTAICSASRASLLTGANHHSCGVDNLVEFETGCQNGQGGIDPQFATMAEILKEYDYYTVAVGKWHLNTTYVRSQAGPFHNWPLGKGFDNYYGFLAADMDQWNPILTRDNTMVEAPEKPENGYHLSEDLTDNAIEYIYHHHLSYPDQPFFLYLAYGAMHTPHHAPKEYIDKYKGKFDQGWDVIRELWFENQKKLGIIPENAELTDRNEYVKPWDSLDERQKKAYARYMEVFAGFLEHTDAQIGRLLDYLEKAGILDDTIIVFLSDNGASAEGGQDGHYNLNTAMDVSDAYPKDVDLILENYDTVGDQYSQPHYPIGWANAGNTPFQWYKMWTYEGGVKDPLIIRYPKAIKDQGGVRGQFAHVCDITPTVLDVLDFKKPETIKGVPQKPLEGISFTNTFESADAPARKTIQYFEIYGNRSIYKDGWKAVVNHTFNKSYAEDQWELYHVDEDYSEKYNVADKYPEKLRELQDAWLIEASKYHVFPMPPNGQHAYRKQLQDTYQFMARRPAQKFVYAHVILPHDLAKGPSVTNATHRVTVCLERKNKEEEGVLFVKGDRFAGVSFYVKDNHLKYVYNVDQSQLYTVQSTKKIPIGKVELSYYFNVIEDDLAEVTLFINGEECGSTTVNGFIYTGSEVTTLKANKYTSVYDKDYAVPFEYPAEIDKIVFDVAEVSFPVEKEVKKGMHVD